MENNNIITTVLADDARPAAEGKKQDAERNPLARFFSDAKSKCKKVITAVTTMVTMTMVSAVTAFAEGGGGGGAVDGEAAFNQVIGFFATWIGRIGLVVAFVGGVMFALAIKNDDAEAKTRGLMTLASGFVVFALTLSLNLFGITA